MQSYHQLHSSRTQLLTSAALHLVAATAIFFLVTPALLQWSGIAAMLLSAMHAHRHLIRQDFIRIRVDRAQNAIELQYSGQPYFYFKYKVYQTRWFAILKLVDQQKGQTLILNSDCFQSDKTYRRLRFDLRQLERSDAA